MQLRLLIWPDGRLEAVVWLSGCLVVSRLFENVLGSQVESEVGDDEAVTTHVEARMAVMN